MAKPPAKKPKKDPARATRAKAARPDAPATPDELADLLNPAIKQGTAGIGSGTGNRSFRGAGEAREPGIQKQAPSQHLDSGPGAARRPGMTDESGLQPPPDNSWERRQDFSAAHTARKSSKMPAREGFGEAPQSEYTGSPITGLDPALAKELGLGDEDDAALPSPRLRGEGGERAEAARAAKAGEPGEGHVPGGDTPSPARATRVDLSPPGGER